MGSDVRLGQIRSDQMKKDPSRSEPDPLKVQISVFITAPGQLGWCVVVHCTVVWLADHTVAIQQLVGSILQIAN